MFGFFPNLSCRFVRLWAMANRFEGATTYTRFPTALPGLAVRAVTRGQCSRSAALRSLGEGGGAGGRRSHRSLRGSWGLLAGAHLEPTYTLKSRWDIGMNPRKMSSGVPRFGSYASKNREGGSKPKNAGKGCRTLGSLCRFGSSCQPAGTMSARFRYIPFREIRRT